MGIARSLGEGITARRRRGRVLAPLLIVFLAAPRIGECEVGVIYELELSSALGAFGGRGRDSVRVRLEGGAGQEKGLLSSETRSMCSQVKPDNQPFIRISDLGLCCSLGHLENRVFSGDTMISFVC